jgi:chemotaxis protein CheD
MAGVRMAEMVVSTNPTDELVALGLGSCIGLAIVEPTAGVAGLAHIVLPESNANAGPAGKFADTAVPELLDLLRKAGAVDRRMQVVIAGGARMFEMSGGLDIGSRNEQAVRAALTSARLTLRASQTGGNQGRTVKVVVGDGLVTVRSAGQQPVTLLEGKRPTQPPRPGAEPRRTTTAGGRVAAVSQLGGAASVGGVRGPRAASGMSGAPR